MRLAVVLVSAALAVVGATADAARTLPRISCSAASPPRAYLASWSPTGGRIAIAQSVGPDTELPEIAADGHAVVGDFQSSWDSPPLAIALSSSGRLAYLKRTGEVDIADGVQTAHIAPRTDPSIVSELGGWSPDGTRVVFTRGTYDARFSAVASTIFLFDTRTGATSSLGEGSAPTWSPDGTWIAFTDRSRLLPNGAPERELDLVRPDGSGRHTILRDVALFAPAWSPDSTHLVFEWAIDRAPQIDTIALDGSDRRDVADAYGPVFWSAAGLVVDLPSVDYGAVVAVVDPQTGRTRPISPAPFKRYAARAVAVSPDGRWVAYTIGSLEGNPPFGVRVVNVDGTNDRGVLDCLGTPGPERILGSPLGDVIAAMGGKDVIDVRGGGTDTVHCGLGRDIVYADRNDHIARDCERVSRRR